MHLGKVLKEEPRSVRTCYDCDEDNNCWDVSSEDSCNRDQSGKKFEVKNTR